MFKKTDNIVFERIHQMKDIMEPTAPPIHQVSQAPKPPSPTSISSPLQSAPKPKFDEVQIETLLPDNLLSSTLPHTLSTQSVSSTLPQPNNQQKGKQTVVHPPSVDEKPLQPKDIDKFKQMCKQWLALNDDIKKLQTAIKVRREFQNQLTPKMMIYMKEEQIEDLDTGDGKLRYTISNRKLPLNKDNIQKKLAEYFKDNKKAENVTTFLMENRDIVKAERLSRTVVKKKQPKIDSKALKL